MKYKFYIIFSLILAVKNILSGSNFFLFTLMFSLHEMKIFMVFTEREKIFFLFYFYMPMRVSDVISNVTKQNKTWTSWDQGTKLCVRLSLANARFASLLSKVMYIIKRKFKCLSWIWLLFHLLALMKYRIYPKYSDTSTPYHICSKIWTSTIHYPVLCLKIAGWVANSVNPDETPHSVASHLGLYCLLRPVCPNIYGKYGIHFFTSLDEIKVIFTTNIWISSIYGFWIW